MIAFIFDMYIYIGEKIAGMQGAPSPNIEGPQGLSNIHIIHTVAHIFVHFVSFVNLCNIKTCANMSGNFGTHGFNIMAPGPPRMKTKMYSIFLL